MDKIQSIINSPGDALLTLIAAALLSIFGAFIKDWILKLFSRFSLRSKQKRIINIRTIRRQARVLLSDHFMLTLYSFRALRMGLVWVTANVLCITLLIYSNQIVEATPLSTMTKEEFLEAFLKRDKSVTLGIFLYIFGMLIFILTIIAGYISSSRNRILFKAYRMRRKQLGIAIKLP